MRTSVEPTTKIHTVDLILAPRPVLVERRRPRITLCFVLRTMRSVSCGAHSGLPLTFKGFAGSQTHLPPNAFV